MMRTSDKPLDESLPSMRRAMELELARRKYISWLTTFVVLALSIFIAALSLVSGADLNAALGEWRVGVVIILGAAFLFSFAMFLQYWTQSRADSDFSESLRSVIKRSEERVESQRSSQQH
jgi:drug/metabolite transporter (DMT)-like permease